MKRLLTGWMLTCLFSLPAHASLELVSRALDLGNQGDASSTHPSTSADGRYVVFASLASNLVANDNNNTRDIFLLDRQSNTLTRINMGLNGAEADAFSYTPAISANGRFIVYVSRATNLIANGSSTSDVYLYDIQTGSTRRISETAGIGGNDSSSNPSISADGRYIVYSSRASNLVAGDSNNKYDIFLHDTQTGDTTRISEVAGVEGNNSSLTPFISADGRFVVYQSYANNLVPADGNGVPDIFLHDTQSGTTVRVSQSNLEADAASRDPGISPDGAYVIFSSDASNLTAGGDPDGFKDVFLYERATGQLQRITAGANGHSQAVAVTHDAQGVSVLFTSSADNLVAGDNNGLTDLFLYRQQGTTTSIERISHDPTGNDPNGPIATIEARPANVFFNNGQGIVFDSIASNLVSNDINNQSDVFIYDLNSQTTTLASLAIDGPHPANTSGGNSLYPQVTDDGRFVVYSSDSEFLVAHDLNNTQDVFLYDSQTGITQRISEVSGTGGNATSFTPDISADGRFVVYQSSADNLVAGDNNFSDDIFLYDVQTGLTTRVSQTGGSGGDDFSYTPAISADGRYVVYGSLAGNLVANDSYQFGDIFLYDTQTGSTRRITEVNGVEANGESFDPAISGDGRFVVFTSTANNQTLGDINGRADVFLHDTQTSITTLVSQVGGVSGNSGSGSPDISADGRFVVYSSSASNLVANDTNGFSDIFLYDTLTNSTRLISQVNGIQGNGNSNDPAISPDGRYITYRSLASNLVDNDTNNAEDVFLYDTLTRSTTRISENAGQNHNGNTCTTGTVSNNGFASVFVCNASNLTPATTSGKLNVFRYIHPVLFFDSMEDTPP